MLPPMRLELPEYDVVGIRAGNASAFTLGGTNSWILGRDPAWLIDPGPNLPDHVDAVTSELNARGGLGGIVVTHRHADHTEAIPTMRQRFPRTPLAAARGEVDVQLGDGDSFGPLRAVHAPGHASDHLVFVAGPVAFTGDAVLGEGSVFLYPDPGALAGYLNALGRLRAQGITTLCPGHGPIVRNAAAKLDEYIAHRLDRERRLVAALDAGKRTVDELLDDAWSDAPATLKPAATVTLAAHLDKLDEEGRLPDGVERPSGWSWLAEV
jgi:glyoxylase-like metal-dependent hydrolase (beta-lactamase superfamily II)